jgi:hypothetical protein
MTNEDVLKANKEKNVAIMKAHHARFGIGRPLPRTIVELTALVGHNPLVGIDAVEIPAVVDDKPCAIPEQDVVETAIRSRYDVNVKPTTGPMLTCREILAEAGLPSGKINANALASVLGKLGFSMHSSNGRRGFRLHFSDAGS